MSGPSSKRPGDELPEQPSKVPKTNTAASKVAEIKPILDITDVPVRDIDKYITTDGSPSGVCSIQMLKHMEAHTAHTTPPFVEYQYRLLAAQARYSGQLAQHACLNQLKFASMKPKQNEATPLAKRVLKYAHRDSIQARPEWRDALYYRVTIIMSYGSYYATPDIANNKYKELAELLEMPMFDLYEELTSASERHLARPADRSSIWESTYTAGPEPTARPPPSSTSKATPISSGPIDTASDAWLDTQVNRLMRSWKDLAVDKSLVPIEEFDDISEEDKITLLETHERRQLEDGDNECSYTGVPLHGAQGTGKTTLVKNWCRHVKGTLITINITAQGPLRGHSER